ncbi:hypothetical protein, partial [Sutterella sp.]|uniref:hypothetical protein n=1 Tax=Sutterella sp. TaxID=1981025 RepID=UPI003FD7F1D3
RDASSSKWAANERPVCMMSSESGNEPCMLLLYHYFPKANWSISILQVLEMILSCLQKSQPPAPHSSPT